MNADLMASGAVDRACRGSEDRPDHKVRTRVARPSSYAAWIKWARLVTSTSRSTARSAPFDEWLAGVVAAARDPELAR
jgi:hypothetical protein